MEALVGFLRRNNGQLMRLPRPRVFRDSLNSLEMRIDDELDLWEIVFSASDHHVYM